MISDVPGYRRGLRVGFVLGLVAAGVLAMCMSPPARGEPIATATAQDGSLVTLHADAGVCPARSYLAVWQSADRRRAVLGCWFVASPDHVSLAYFDGDAGRIPGAQLVRLRAV